MSWHFADLQLLPFFVVFEAERRILPHMSTLVSCLRRTVLFSCHAAHFMFLWDYCIWSFDHLVILYLVDATIGSYMYLHQSFCFILSHF